jgi:hypothetical protein
MKIVTSGYPVKLSFETNKHLPAFKPFCEVRTDMLRDELRKLKYEHPYHEIEDFIVELVETKNGKEFWYIGS